MDSNAVTTSGVAVCTLPAPYVRGLLASRSISPTDRVVTVPLAATINIESACGSGDVCRRIGSNTTPLREDDQLAIMLILERSLLEKSAWWSHISQLPTLDSSPFYWTREEIDALPRGSSCHALFLKMTQQLEDDHDKLRSACSAVLEACPEPGFDVLQLLTLDAYRWAISMVWSRFVSVIVTPDSRPLKCMLPVFDMANHSRLSGAYHEFDAERGCIALVAGQSWEIGQQVSLPYGDLPPLESVKLYGGVFDDPAESQRTLIEVSMGSNAPLFDRKVQMWRDLVVAPSLRYTRSGLERKSVTLNADAEVASCTLEIGLADSRAFSHSLALLLRCTRIQLADSHAWLNEIADKCAVTPAPTSTAAPVAVTLTAEGEGVLPAYEYMVASFLSAGVRSMLAENRACGATDPSESAQRRKQRTLRVAAMRESWKRGSDRLTMMSAFIRNHVCESDESTAGSSIIGQASAITVPAGGGSDIFVPAGSNSDDSCRGALNPEAESAVFKACAARALAAVNSSPFTSDDEALAAAVLALSDTHEFRLALAAFLSTVDEIVLHGLALALFRRVQHFEALCSVEEDF